MAAGMPLVHVLLLHGAFLGLPAQRAVGADVMRGRAGGAAAAVRGGVVPHVSRSADRSCQTSVRRHFFFCSLFFSSPSGQAGCELATYQIYIETEKERIHHITIYIISNM